MEAVSSEAKRRKQLLDLDLLDVVPADHTNGTSAGFPVPASMVADGDLAVGRLIDAVSHSPFWSSTAIFVTEDDSQDGVDHVDGIQSARGNAPLPRAGHRTGLVPPRMPGER
jgi:hypothetical protein